MYVPMLRLLTTRAHLMRIDDTKSALRTRLLSAFLFVLQTAPEELLAAMWRQLLLGCRNCGRSEFPSKSLGRGDLNSDPSFDPTLLGVFDLLNLSLASLEYSPATSAPGKQKTDAEDHRMWFSHDANMIVLKTARSVVNELLYLLDPSTTSTSKDGKDLHTKHVVHLHAEGVTGPFSVADVATIVRTVASVYLHGLSLHISDAAAISFISASVELLKAVGLNLFLVALEDTLQDWMRVLFLHTGARRATVRVQALEFIVLLLRANWTAFGNLTTLKTPSLAVFGEVCEKMALSALKESDHTR